MPVKTSEKIGLSFMKEVWIPALFKFYATKAHLVLQGDSVIIVALILNI
jgi:hypothetical protein